MNIPVFWVYSVMHTGTWFLIKILETAYPKNKIIKYTLKSKEAGWLEKPVEESDSYILELRYSMEHGSYIENKDYPKGHEEILACCSDITDEQKEKIKVIIINGHHQHPSSFVYNEMNTISSWAKIVIPMRDPLLSLWTLYRRNFNTIDEILLSSIHIRVYLTYAHMKNIVENLKIRNSFIFPIDIDCPISFRENKINGLFEFCNLEKTQETEQFIEKWPVVNDTIEALPGRQYDHTTFEEWKNKLSTIEGVRELSEVLYPELNTLQTFDGLVESLRDIGYIDLPWYKY